MTGTGGPKRDPRINPRAGDVFDDEVSGTRYFIDNVGGGSADLKVMEVRFYTTIKRSMWRRFAQQLRPLCIRVTPISPTAILHGSRRKSGAIE